MPRAARSPLHRNRPWHIARTGVASIVTNRHVIDASYSDETSSPAAPKSSTILVHMLGQPPAEGRIAWVAPPGVDLAIVTVPCGSREVRAAKYPAEHPPRLGDQAFAVVGAFDHHAAEAATRTRWGGA